jgi:hypothetical protein
MTSRARSFADMMIQVIQSKRIGNYEVEAAAEVIAADARFNICFVEHIKGKPGRTERSLALFDLGEELLVECADAVDTFIAGGPREPLRSTLWAIQKKLNGMRE